MRKIIISILAGTALLSACEKKTYEANERDAVVQITVVDDKGTPQAGASILIFDEKGYEQFQQDHKAEPAAYTLTLPDGKVNYRLPYEAWFTKGSRQVTFVVMELADEDNYHIWAISRTIKAADKVQIDFKLDRSNVSPTDPSKPDETGESGDSGETGETGKPDSPASPAENSGTLLEMFDEENGHTLFGEALFLDNDHRFDGNNRYTIADAGQVDGLAAMTNLTLDRAAHRISAWPRHGYFVAKDISLMEFPSGKRALAVGSQYAKIYVSEWITRDEKNVGVKLHYLVEKLACSDLPEWGKVYEVKLTTDRTVSIPLPTLAADSECAPWGKTPLRISFSEDHVTLQITDSKAAAGKEYRFVIRAGACYTEARLKLVD